MKRTKKPKTVIRKARKLLDLEDQNNFLEKNLPSEKEINKMRRKTNPLPPKDKLLKFYQK